MVKRSQDENENTPTTAELVNRLFQTHVNPSNGKEWSNSEVAREIGVHHSTIQAIRSGKITNPNRETMKKLALWFRVPANYFFPDVPLIESDPEEALQFALRSFGVDNESNQQEIRDLIKRLGKQ